LTDIDKQNTKHKSNKQTMHNTAKQNYPGSVASYDTRSGNETDFNINSARLTAHS